MDLLFYTSIILTGISVFIIANTFFSEEEKFKASEKLDDAASTKTTKDLGIVYRFSGPFIKRYFAPMLNNLKNKKKIRSKYKQKLANAGLTNDLTPDNFFAFKVFLILGFPVLFLGVKYFGEFHDWPLSITPFMGIVGYFYPDNWIGGRIKMRQRDIIQGMPFVVDMLALSVEAGLDFVAAISKVVDKAPPSAITEEFEILMKEIRIGSSRAEALRAMSWRTGVIEMSSFCATLIAADSVGASIGPILKSLSQDIRQKRSALIEKEGAKAATKILFPMMAFIVPAVFLVIITPLALELFTGGS